jgi:hypothetical protein
MKRKRIATLAAVLAGASIGLAGPASAELVDGTYDMVRTGGEALHLVVTSCGAGCKQTSINGGTPRDYHLEGNTWRCVYGDGLVSTVDNNSLVFQDGSDRFVFLTAQLVKVN